MSFYAGIGSRKTPNHILAGMTLLANQLEQRGFSLRSGNAIGADQAFQAGTTKKEVHLPWPGYNNGFTGKEFIVPMFINATMAIAARHHPAWDRLSQGAQKLMARNVTIILGHDLSDPVDFVVCWTPDGKITGGTGHSIRIAKTAGIPVFNLANEEHIPLLDAFIEQMSAPTAAHISS